MENATRISADLEVDGRRLVFEVDLAYNPPRLIAIPLDPPQQARIVRSTVVYQDGRILARDEHDDGEPNYWPAEQERPV